MQTSKTTSVVLVIDDDEEFRDDILPTFVERKLGARAVTAASIAGGIKQLSEHTRNTAEPAQLLILDMHMPESEAHVNVLADAGLQIMRHIRALREYKLVDCPIVVFTAYPSYANCVESVKAGADAYVPKYLEKPSDKSALDLLEEACKTVLKLAAQPGIAMPPSKEWLDRNYQWLLTAFPGYWVAFVSEEAARTVAIAGYVARDGVALVADDSYEAVRRQLLQVPAVLNELPIRVLLELSGEFSLAGVRGPESRRRSF